jgi:hypothetical protein
MNHMVWWTTPRNMRCGLAPVTHFPVHSAPTVESEQRLSHPEPWTILDYFAAISSTELLSNASSDWLQTEGLRNLPHTPSRSSRFLRNRCLRRGCGRRLLLPQRSPSQSRSVPLRHFAVPTASTRMVINRLEAPRPTPCPLQGLVDGRGALPPAAGLRSLLRRKPFPSFPSPRSRHRVHLRCHVPSTCPVRSSPCPPPRRSLFLVPSAVVPGRPQPHPRPRSFSSLP